MSRTLYENLNNNGSMFGIICVLGQSPSGSLTCCDFFTDFEQAPKEGEAYKIFFRGQNESITNYNWSQESYHKALEAAGFKNIEWHKAFYSGSPELNPESVKELLHYPVFIAVTGNK